MERSKARELGHVALPTAAAIVHIELTGAPPDAASSDPMRRVLNDVAHALASVVPIWVQDRATGLAVELPPSVLLGGRFDRGAHVLFGMDGTEYRGMTVQRRDIESAVAILRGARVDFRRR